MDNLKRYSVAIVAACMLSNTHSAHAFNIKTSLHAASNFLYKAFIVRSVPEEVAAKRKLQLTAAMQRFKTRAQNLSSKKKSAAPLKASPEQYSPTAIYMNRFKYELNHPWMQEYIQKYQNIIQKIIMREKEHSESHYVFYHAHRSKIRIIHDVIQELYRFFFQQAHLKRFKCVRFWKDHARFSSAHTFLNFYNVFAFIPTFDTAPWIAQQLLCVNLSLFGNRTYGGESTFAFFLNNNSFICEWLETYFKDLFFRLGINEKWAQPLMNLAEQELHYAPDHRGQILQIFIPKKDVDKYIYASKAFGIPHGPIAAPFANAAFSKIFQRHNSIIPILESYQKNPFEMDDQTYDHMQARLILTAQIFDPKSDVKIYRYSAIPKEQINRYKQQLRDIITCALEEWCATYTLQKSIPSDLGGTAIDILLSNP